MTLVPNEGCWIKKSTAIAQNWNSVFVSEKIIFIDSFKRGRLPILIQKAIETVQTKIIPYLGTVFFQIKCKCSTLGFKGGLWAFQLKLPTSVIENKKRILHLEQTTFEWKVNHNWETEYLSKKT